MPRIFISYRRADTGSYVGRISDRLKAAFGDENIFRDLVSINPGADFRGAIREEVSKADIVLALIGPSWLDILQQRLNSPQDWVRLEIETGLQRDRVTVIPLLLDGATMPSADDLPDPIRELAYKNAFPVRVEDPFFERDIQNLIAALRPAQSNTVGSLQAEGVSPAQSSSTGKAAQFLGRPWWQGVSAIVGILAVLVAIFALPQLQSPTPDLTATHAITQTAAAMVPTATPGGNPMATFLTGVNVRSGPNTIFEPPIGALSVNDTVEVLAVSPDGGWYKVRYEGGEGWVFASLVEVSGDIDSLPVDAGPDVPVLAPTNTPTEAPTATPTDAPTSTPTQTPLPPTATFTNTSPPPTATDTPRPSDTPTQASADNVTVTIFRDEDSFTLYVPESDEPVSLAGLEFRVVLADGETVTRRLDDYSASWGLPVESIDLLGAICFRLVRSGGTRPVPADCQSSGVLLFPQQIASADVFWYDRTLGLERTVLVWQNGQLLGACGAGDSCEVELPERVVVPTSTPAPTNTIAPTSLPTTEVARGYPCEGTITNPDSSASVFNIAVYLEPSSQATQHSMRVGQIVTVQRKQTVNGSQHWFLIYREGQRLGWVLSRYLVLSESCPG